MNKKLGPLTVLQWRLVTIAVVSLACVYMFAGLPPSLKNIGERIRLGLDLSGGTQITVEVVTDDALRINTDGTIESLRAELVKESIPVKQLNRSQVDEFTVEGVDAAKAEDFRRIIGDNYKEWDLRSTPGEGGNSFSLKLKAPDVLRIRESAVSQAINTIRNRIDSEGLAEAGVQKQGGAGEYQLMVQFPGVSDPEKVKSLIQKTALLEFKIVDGLEGFTDKDAATKHYPGGLPPNLEILPAKPGRGNQAFYVVSRVAGVTGRDLKDSYTSRDENGRSVVGFTMTPDGARRFGRLTEENIGKGLAIVLDGKVQSAPKINSRITDSGQITSDYTVKELQELILLLKSGSLPARITFLQEQVLGPSLGRDSINHGVTAAIIALAAVVVFVLFYYRGAGINASVAMILNLLILLAAMAWFGATMTLPGMAGVILTIGVGIDSNVLVFERIREELHAGKTPGSAVGTAFKRVFVTLVDTHLAALISAVILYYASGSGPVRGFAVTLMIGLVSNMFTAVFVSRTLFEIVLGRKERAEAISI